MNKARLFLAAFGLAFLIIMITSVDRIIKIENNNTENNKTKLIALKIKISKEFNIEKTDMKKRLMKQTALKYYGKTILKARSEWESNLGT